MPITIVLPGPNGPIGIGISTQVDLDPSLFLEGDQLEVTLQDGAETQRVIGFGRRTDLHGPFSVNVVIGELQQTPTPFWQTYPQWPTAVAGSPVRVVWRHLRSNADLVDQHITTQTYDPTTGLQWAIPHLVSSPVSGGFTETDRLVMNTIQANTTAQLVTNTTAGGSVDFAIDQVLKGPPVDLLAEGESLLLSGRGSITRASGATGVYAYGGRWNIEDAPLGLGQEDGQAISYEQRISQFVVVKNRLGGGGYAAEIADSHYDSGELTWGIPFPVRIDYYILPGVTVRWRWLLFLQ